MASKRLRPTLWDALDLNDNQNIYCKRDVLENEASVEMFFLNPLLKDLGYRDDQIKTKASIEAIKVGKGSKKINYKPDYALIAGGNPRCIIDAKSPNETLAEWIEQCSGYCLALNRRFESENPVKYFVLCNGDFTEVYAWDNETPLLVLEFSDFSWGNPKYEKLRLLLASERIALSESISSTSLQNFTLTRPTGEKARHLFSQCHRVIWKSGYGPQAAFLAFIKIMFVKLWSDRRLRHEPGTAQFFENDAHSVSLPSSSVTFSVAWIEAREREGIPNPIDSMLFSTLRDDLETNITLRKKKRLFDKSESINVAPHVLKDVVQRLEHFDMFGIDEDLNGRLFETFLSSTMRGKDLGQFFTPRSIVKLMSQMAMLVASSSHIDRVLDGCCGSGGFLIEALTLMRNSIRNNHTLTGTKRKELLDQIANESLYGIDFGKEPPLARIARINMYLHGDGGSRIYRGDALDKELEVPGEDDPEGIQNQNELKEKLSSVKFNVVLTNPPFSMTYETKNETQRGILNHYTIAHKTPAKLRTTLRSSIMFLERYWGLLEDGGKLITVIDDTLLSSADFDYVREYIRRAFTIRAIISLPGDAFRRQGARVKTSVLILEKKSNPEEGQVGCYYHFAEHLGVDDLTPRASEEEIQHARAKSSEEIKHVVEEFKSYINGKPVKTALTPDRIKGRLDLKFCVPDDGMLNRVWRKEGADVLPLDKIVDVIENVIYPKEYPEEEFILLKVNYAGKCVVEKQKKGRQIKAPSMYKVTTGDLIFSTIRATDGSIGVVPQKWDGALVSTTSYNVLRAKTLSETAYLWAVLRSFALRAEMQARSPGTGRYTTYWEDIRNLQIPWVGEDFRKQIGDGIIKVWKAEMKVEEEKASALLPLDKLSLNSATSKKRWLRSKAPT